MAVPSFDYLDSMMWSIAASGVILAIAMLRLHYNSSTDSFGDEHKNLAKGFGVALGATGFYVFITGLSIGFLWPFGSTGGIYNVLFGGVAVLGGLMLLAIASALFLGHGLQAATYFGVVFALYLIVDAYSILSYSVGTVKITKDPTLSALLYLAPTPALFFSVPATHINNKWLRRGLGVLVLVFAIGWLYFALNTTYGHLKPPAPTA